VGEGVGVGARALDESVALQPGDRRGRASRLASLRGWCEMSARLMMRFRREELGWTATIFTSSSAI